MLQTTVIIGTAVIGYLLDCNNKPKMTKKSEYPLEYIKDSEEIQEESPYEKQKEQFTDIQAINENKSNVDKRPVNDYLVNNIVPFGAKFTQDMRGTGVPSSNYDSEKYNLGNDSRTPFNTQLGHLTGQDDTYLHKREVPIQFSPLEQRDRSQIPTDDPGNVRPLRDRYTTSILHKNEMAPTERQQVGPGLNINANAPTGGQGFNSGLTTEVKLQNFSDYKLHEHPGRIAGTKYQASNLPTALPSDGVPKNTGGNQLFTYDDRPPAPQIVQGKAQTIQSEVMFPSNTSKRELSNVEFGESVKIK